MALYNIYAGMGGGFGGATLCYAVECASIEEATQIAYTEAIAEYESYEGMHGIMSYDDCAIEVILAEEEVEYEDYELPMELLEKYSEEIEDMYLEEKEGWIDYYAILASEDKE